MVYSDFNTDAAGNRERIAYLFDKRAAVFTGLAAEVEPPRKKMKVIVDGNHSKLFPGQTMTKTEFAYQLSDHLPLWVQLNTDLDAERLDQILNPA